jgi:hypothetical protein
VSTATEHVSSSLAFDPAASFATVHVVRLRARARKRLYLSLRNDDYASLPFPLVASSKNKEENSTARHRRSPSIISRRHPPARRRALTIVRAWPRAPLGQRKSAPSSLTGRPFVRVAPGGSEAKVHAPRLIINHRPRRIHAKPMLLSRGATPRAHVTYPRQQLGNISGACEGTRRLRVLSAAATATGARSSARAVPTRVRHAARSACALRPRGVRGASQGHHMRRQSVCQAGGAAAEDSGRCRPAAPDVARPPPLRGHIVPEIA